MRSVYIPKIWMNFKPNFITKLIESATNKDGFFLFSKVDHIDFQPYNNLFQSCFVHFEEPLPEYTINAIKNNLIIRCFYDVECPETIGIHRIFIKENLSKIQNIHSEIYSEISKIKQRLEIIETCQKQDRYNDWEVIK